MSINSDVSFSNASSGVLWYPPEMLYELIALNKGRIPLCSKIPLTIFLNITPEASQQQLSQQGGQKVGATNYTKEEILSLVGSA